MKDSLTEDIICNFSRLDKKMKDNKKSNSSKKVKSFNNSIRLKEKKFYGLTPFLFFLCLILMLPIIAQAASITMTWDRNQEPDIAGYRIYYGTQSGQYNNSITVYDSATQPLQLSYTVAGLSEGTTYYFALKTFDQAGQESDYSVETSQNIPGGDGGGTSFGSPTTWISTFAYGAGGWQSQDKYPRMLADVNGDGLADIVGFGYAGTLVALSNGASFDRPTMWIENFAYGAGGWQSQDKFPRMLADVNGDGLADIVGFGYAGTLVALSNGASFDRPTMWIENFAYGAGGWISQDRYPRMLADVNGDGMADIVGFGHAGAYVALSNGAGFDSPSTWISAFAYGAGGWISQDRYPRMLADVNGDGMADIVGFGHAGAYVALSNGAGFDSPSTWISAFAYGAGGWISQDRYPRMLADVNGDGMADIVGFGHAGAYVALSNGAGFDSPSTWISAFAYSAGGWISQDKYPRMLADVNGDGMADIVGFEYAGAYVALSN